MCSYVFNKSEYSDFKKYLFVLSDGAPSDIDNIGPTISGLKDANVKIISCYVGNSSNIEPKRLYINKINKSATANKQEKGTCYANAVAAVLHLAMKRILNREGGYPDFFKLRQNIIEAFGEDGAAVSNVLAKFSKEYRLRYEEKDAKEAMIAITSNRPIITTFFLTSRERKAFRIF
ncbi:unnamed protein product [Mytilus edulis]|uniref:VWFA domain-containing protein n=1 Tax=Mytilus edulis TaxID=6550 RepID=A0A8S3UUU3_MYTED|nr:unnamed protein product [Mytilus edulis]